MPIARKTARHVEALERHAAGDRRHADVDRGFVDLVQAVIADGVVTPAERAAIETRGTLTVADAEAQAADADAQAADGTLIDNGLRLAGVLLRTLERTEWFERVAAEVADDAERLGATWNGGAA